MWYIRYMDNPLEKVLSAKFYSTSAGNEMILLHGFIKKTQKTPKSEIGLAVKRKKEHEKHE
jgi:phage-related protein